MTALIVIEAVVILLLLILVAGLLKSHAEILRQLHTLGLSEDESVATVPLRRTTAAAKAPATQIGGVDPSGAERIVSLDHERGNTLIAFLSSGCPSCQAFWEELANSPDMPDPDTRMVIVTKGPSSESPGEISALAPPDIPLVMSDDAWDRFRVPATPYFLMTDGEARIIGEGSANGWSQLVRLFRRSARDALDPKRLDTSEREDFTDSRVSGAGLEPEDPSLYENPLGT